MFHISSLFYPKRFRQLITRLKREGTFREQPLSELDKRVYLLVALLTVLYTLFHLGEPLPQGFTVCFALVVFFGIALDVRQAIRRIVVPYTIGVLHPFLLVEGPQYHYFRYPRGWYMVYVLLDENGKAGRHYTMQTIAKKCFDKESFMVAPFQALVDPQNPDLNFPRIEKLVQAYRMTTVPLPPPELPEGN